MFNDSVIRLEGVTRVFNVGQRRVKALSGLDLEVRHGETLAIVGESGSGKTTLGNIVLGIDRPTAGRIWFDGVEIQAARSLALRRRIQVVQQNPYATLNPKRTIRQTLELPLAVHNLRPRGQRKARIDELLQLVGIPREYLDRYPETLSGGQRQRIALARALAAEPDVIVLDEPTSALDVSVQARILQLLVKLQELLHLTYLFITHDLSVVRNVADQVAVLYRGHLVEAGRTAAIFRTPKHRYTTMLLSSIPVVSADEESFKPRWDWSRGTAGGEGSGEDACPFLPRCPYAIDQCGRGVPLLAAASLDQGHACLNPSTAVINGVHGAQGADYAQSHRAIVRTTTNGEAHKPS